MDKFVWCFTPKGSKAHLVGEADSGAMRNSTLCGATHLRDVTQWRPVASPLSTEQCVRCRTRMDSINQQRGEAKDVEVVSKDNSADIVLGQYWGDSPAGKGTQEMIIVVLPEYFGTVGYVRVTDIRHLSPKDFMDRFKPFRGIRIPQDKTELAVVKEERIRPTVRDALRGIIEGLELFLKDP